jgi:hypothetical protein
VQINDEAAFGESGGFTTFNGRRLGIETFGPSGSRQVTEQWGTDAVSDPRDLKALQDLYRAAHGLPPLPDPEAIAFLKRKGGKGKGEGGQKGKGEGEGPERLPPPRVEPARYQQTTTSPGGGGSTPTPSGDGGSSGDGDPEVPIEVLLRDVPPPGWFHVGGKKDVPAEACHVGRWGDCYVWVTPEGVPALSRFTLAVLSVLKFEAGGAGGNSGLAVTR